MGSYRKQTFFGVVEEHLTVAGNKADTSIDPASLVISPELVLRFLGENHGTVLLGIDPLVADTERIVLLVNTLDLTEADLARLVGPEIQVIHLVTDPDGHVMRMISRFTFGSHHRIIPSHRDISVRVNRVQNRLGVLLAFISSEFFPVDGYVNRFPILGAHKFDRRSPGFRLVPGRRFLISRIGLCQGKVPQCNEHQASKHRYAILVFHFLNQQQRNFPDFDS